MSTYKTVYWKVSFRWVRNSEEIQEEDGSNSSSVGAVISRTTMSIMFSFISSNERNVQRGEVASPHIEENLAERRNIQRTPPGQL